MKKYILSALVVGSATLLTSCNDMLDSDPRVTQVTADAFPGKVADVEALNAATYSVMNTMGGGDSDSSNPFYWWEIMSDNCYGSGGLQDNKVKSMHYLVQMSTDQYESPYSLLYGGIQHANNMIETIDNVDWTDKTDTRNQLLGEAYFMRGLYTLWLTQLYGDVILMTSTKTTPDQEVQVSAEDVIYPQILSDFVSGKNLMGTEKGRGDGHANKFVAEAFAARAYMFWAGFYKHVGELANGDATINLVEQEGCQGGSLSKNDIVGFLKDIISNGGYKLCEDYRSLWQYSNSYVWQETQDGGGIKEIKDKYAKITKTTVDGKEKLDTTFVDQPGDGIVVIKDTIRTGHTFDFIKDMKKENCFDQPGMGNGNTEELFQIQFMNASKWSISGLYSSPRMYCNYLSTFWGLRVNGNNGNRDCTYPFTQGWGQGTPSCNIWDDWTVAEKNGNYTDIRKLGSLIDCNNELKAYSYVKDDCEESGYAVKKWCGVTTDGLTGDSPWWDLPETGWTSSSLDNPMQGDHFEDFYLMRYADVLLMATELTGDAQYMNQVQRRAGVPETPYSLKAVQDERRWEFAFEGLRFNDMRRWTGKDTKDGYATKALEAQGGKMVVCYGDKGNKQVMKHMTCSWKQRYEATNGFVAKPQSQVNLLNGRIQQNEGWDAADETTLYKTLY